MKGKGLACSQKGEIDITTARLHATMSLRILHGDNGKQHRYLAILSCDSERSVLFNNHIPEKVERRVIVFSERFYLQTITEQAIQHYSQPVISCNGLLPIVIFRICVG